MHPHSGQLSYASQNFGFYMDIHDRSQDLSMINTQTNLGNFRNWTQTATVLYGTGGRGGAGGCNFLFDRQPATRLEFLPLKISLHPIKRKKQECQTRRTKKKKKKKRKAT